MATMDKIFNWKDQSNHIRNIFKSMHLNGDLCDVILYCQKRSIRAHKTILAAGSSYFYDLFKEVATPNPVIVFKNVRYEDLFAVVTYIYDGTVAVTINRCGAFKETAKMLEIDLMNSEVAVDSVNYDILVSTIDDQCDNGKFEPHIMTKNNAL